MSAVAKLNELLFENTDKIPEGLYLELMNLTKDIFNEKPEPITIHNTRMVYTEPKIHLLRTIKVNPRGLYETPSISLYDARGFRIMNDKKQGAIFEITAYGNDRIFYEIVKINKCSVKMVEKIFSWDISINKYKAYHYRFTIKIAEKYGLNESGVAYLDLTNKDIRFYNYTSAKIYGDFQECIENTETETLPVDF